MSFTNPGQPPPTVHPAPENLEIVHAGFLDQRQEMLVVCAASGGNPPSLHAINRLTGASQPVPTPLAPALVAIGRNGQVYLSSGQIITVLLYPAPGNGPTLTLPFPAHDMTYDDPTDDVVLFSRTARKVMRYDRNLPSAPPVILNVPTNFPLGLKVQMALEPPALGNALWVWTDAPPHLFRLVPNTTSGFDAFPFVHPALPAPQGISFDDHGHMFVSTGGSIVELAWNEAQGWAVVPDSGFAGLPAHHMLQVDRSRTNFEPGVHDVPGWTTNIDPAELPASPQAGDCNADIAPLLNVDGFVNVNDLLQLINGWGACPSEIMCLGDIDESGVVDINDLLLLISSWGSCP
jgi:hypothetical protein